MKKILIVILILGIFGGSSIAPIYKGVALAQTNQPAAAEKPIVDTALDSFSCKLRNWTVQGCLIQGAYYILFLPAVLLSALFGKLLDASIDFSIASTSYDNTNVFIERGWTILRDLSNIFFIFALLVAAIGTILGLHSANAKKTIASVIVVGLLINFSLFFSKVIIDASHITARVFYSSIHNTSGTSNPGISASLMKKINPQTILSEAKWKDAPLKETNQQGQAVATITDNDNKATKAIITLVVAGVMTWMLVYLFAVLAFLFITRVLTLWLCMIFAPLSFGSLLIPKMAHMQYIGFSSWLKNLASAAFMAPVFLFFVYLIIRFMNVITPLTSSTSGSWFSQVLKTIFPFIVIFGLLIAAKKVSINMSGAIGKGTAQFAGNLAKMAGSAATGFYTGAATMAIGGAGAKIAGSSALKNAEAGGGIKGTFAGALRSGGKMLSTNSLDWRSTAAGKGIAKSLGIETGGAVESYQQRVQAFRKKKELEMKDLEVSEDEPVMRAMQEWREKFGQELIHLDHQIEEAKAAVKENGTAENKQKLADLKEERSNVKKGLDAKNISNLKNKVREAEAVAEKNNTPENQKALANLKGELANAKKGLDKDGKPVKKNTVEFNGKSITLSALEDKRDHMNVNRRAVFADTVQRNEVLGMRIPDNLVTRAFGIRNQSRNLAADDIRRHHHVQYTKKKEDHGGGGHGGGGGAAHDEGHHDEGHGGGGGEKHH